MRAFIEYLVQSVVDLPEEVRVDEEQGDMATTYHVHVAQSDRGKAIGKQGRIANAMRVIAKANAKKRKLGWRVYINIVGETISVEANAA